MRQPGNLRIVSLAPSATNILVSLGARRHLVGVSKWCRHVADVRGLPVLGDCWTLDPRHVERLKPDLVIGSVPFKAETVGELLQKPLTFLAQNPRTLADIYKDIRILGLLTHRQQAAARVIAGMQTTLAALAKAAAFRRLRPVVYGEAWPKPRISSPPWVAELVQAAGGRFAVTPGQRVTDEEVAAAAPEIMILAWAAAGRKSKPESALKNPSWHNVPAVRHHRVYALPDEWLNTPAPILLKGARELSGLLRA